MTSGLKLDDDDIPDKVASWIFGILISIITATVFAVVRMWAGVIEGLGVDRDGLLGTFLSWGLAIGTIILIGAIISLFV